MRGYRSALKDGLIFGVIIAILVYITENKKGVAGNELIIAVVLTGIVSGILFAWTARTHNRRMGIDYEDFRRQLREKGELIHEDAAQENGDELVTGWLFLSGDTLYFKTVYGIAKSFALADISEIKVSRTMGVVNGFTVSTPSKSATFCLSGAKKWISEIEKLR